MDSYVLAETFKYLYLLFADEGDLLLDMDDFVFNTEAHLLPLFLANVNTTLNRIIRDTVSQHTRSRGGGTGSKGHQLLLLKSTTVRL